MHCNHLADHDRVGHDRFGHLIAAALVRADLLPASPEEWAALTDDQVLNLPNLGPVALRRIRAASSGCPSEPVVDAAHGPRRTKRPGRLQVVPCTCRPGLVPLGHDELGHALSMRLARAGWFAGDVDALATLSDEDLLNMRYIGPTSLARIRQHVSHRASPRTGRSTRARRPAPAVSPDGVSRPG